MENLIGRVLYSDPLLFYAGIYTCRNDTVLDAFQSSLRHKEAIFLMLTAWTQESRFERYSEKTDRIKSWVEKRKALFPLHEYVFMANTFLEAYQLQQSGISCELFNHNAFLDPEVYKPAIEPKIFDCVYNAQFVDFKRHHLLAKTDSCLLLSHKLDKEYFDTFILPRLNTQFTIANPLDLSNADNPSLKAISNDEVVRSLNSAKVGICLSKAEGAMHAAVEYLLCDLPVLTTGSEGGRDFFFDGRFVFYAPDDDYVISEGIKALANTAFPPNFIREETIRKQDEVITHFCSYLDKIIWDRRQKRTKLINIWPDIYYNKLLESKHLDKHIEDVDRVLELEPFALAT